MLPYFISYESKVLLTFAFIFGCKRSNCPPLWLEPPIKPVQPFNGLILLFEGVTNHCNQCMRPSQILEHHVWHIKLDVFNLEGVAAKEQEDQLKKMCSTEIGRNRFYDLSLLVLMLTRGNSEKIGALLIRRRTRERTNPKNEHGINHFHHFQF